MRPLTLTALLLMAIGLSSCSTTWQYMTLNSHEVTKDSAKRFTWENDTMRLIYNYNGYAGPFWVSVHNKTDKPMYINWKKSAVINSGYALSLSPSDMKVAATLDASRGSEVIQTGWSPAYFGAYRQEGDVLFVASH